MAQAVDEPERESTEPDAAAFEHMDAELGTEAQDLLADLTHSQAEVLQMLKAQQDQAAELGNLKLRLANELQELQDEAWRLQTYGELGILRDQLEALTAMEQDLDAAEAYLNASDGSATDGQVLPDAQDGDAAEEEDRKEDGEAGNDAAGGVDEGDDGRAELEEIAKLQADLDAELEQMMQQLTAIRSEAGAVTERKAALERELAELLAQQHDMGDDGGLEDVRDEEAAGDQEPRAAAADSALPGASTKTAPTSSDVRPSIDAVAS